MYIGIGGLERLAQRLGASRLCPDWLFLGPMGSLQIVHLARMCACAPFGLVPRLGDVLGLHADLDWRPAGIEHSGRIAHPVLPIHKAGSSQQFGRFVPGCIEIRVSVELFPQCHRYSGARERVFPPRFHPLFSPKSACRHRLPAMQATNRKSHLCSGSAIPFPLRAPLLSANKRYFDYTALKNGTATGASAPTKTGLFRQEV